MTARSSIPLGHTIPAHRVFGWCAYCSGRTPAEELAAWQTRELRRMADETQQAGTETDLCDHDSQVMDHEGAQYWVCMKCGRNLGLATADGPAQPTTSTPDTDTQQDGEASRG